MILLGLPAARLGDGLGGKKEHMFFWWHASNIKLYRSNSHPEYLTWMKHNASIVYAYLKGKGWAKEAIWAVLGNMEHESHINPGYWEKGRAEPDNNDIGYGLVQWSPGNYYLKNNYDGPWNRDKYSDTSIFGQLDRIIFEVDEGLQWYTHKTARVNAAAWAGVPSDTFKNFINANTTRDLGTLTKQFCIWYLDPGVVEAFANSANPSQKAKNALRLSLDERTASAAYWKDYYNW